MSSRRKFLEGALMAAGAMLGAPLAARAANPAPYVPIQDIPNHRQLMRDVVIALSDYCKRRRSDFVVMARNAPELLIKEQREADLELGRDPTGVAQGRYAAVGSVDGRYLNAIDGLLVDSPFYGYDSYEKPTRADDQALLLAAVSLMQEQGRGTLSIDYCKDAAHVSDAKARAQKAKLLAYVDTDGDKLLGKVPAAPPVTENARHVTTLADARNFLPLLTSSAFAQRERWFESLSASNHDLLLIDPFFRASSMTLQDMKTLKFKRIGSQRMVLAIISVGYALTDSFYWQRGWKSGNPKWLAVADPDMPSRFLVDYWSEGWKAVLGNYITGLCDLGVDGVLLDGIDAYLLFEEMLPI